MKKILYSILLLTFILLPHNVFAAEAGFSVSKESVSLKENGTEQIEIIAYDAIGVATITSSDTSIVEVSKSSWDTGNIDDDQTVSTTVTLTAKKAGTAKITIAINGAYFVYPSVLINETKTINVTVTENDGATSYVVQYDANGGKDAPAKQTKEDGVELTLHTTKPTRNGYEFTGWNTKKDGSGTKYSAGSKYTSNANVTLYAQWKKTGNVTENPNTGDNVIYVILLSALGGLIYSYWYMNKAKEN